MVAEDMATHPCSGTIDRKSKPVTMLAIMLILAAKNMVAGNIMNTIILKMSFPIKFNIAWPYFNKYGDCYTK